MSINVRNVRLDAQFTSRFTRACMTPSNNFEKRTKENVISLMVPLFLVGKSFSRLIFLGFKLA